MDDAQTRLRHETTFEDEIFDSLDLGGASLAGKEFSRCTFRGVKLNDTVWHGTLLEDCTLDGCDLSNVRLKGASLRGVELRTSKLVGTFWTDLAASPTVTFTDCGLRYASFASLLLRATTFTRCAITEATFQQVDLARSVFKDCDLARTQLDGCTLTGTDFTSATGVHFDPTRNRSKGAKISVTTAAAMASALGLVVAGYPASKG